MKTFKSFIQLDEVERAKYKEGIANKLSGVSYLAQTKDPGDLEHVGPEEMGPKGIKTASGKRPADRLDNKQPFGEDVELNEDDFTPQQTKMAHTIGKEFAKKKVGDTYKGGPYAVASAMVKNKPEAAQKAYNTIKAKMKEEADADLLYKVYNDLNEQNRIVFMNRLETDAEDLLQFAKHMED